MLLVQEGVDPSELNGYAEYAIQKDLNKDWRLKCYRLRNKVCFERISLLREKVLG